MANSPLTRTGEKKPVVDKGHGTDALGPSDTSDSGSDIRGPGLLQDGRRLLAGARPRLIPCSS